MFTDSNRIIAWESKGLLEGIKPPATSDNILSPGLNYINYTKI